MYSHIVVVKVPYNHSVRENIKFVRFLFGVVRKRSFDVLLVSAPMWQAWSFWPVTDCWSIHLKLLALVGNEINGLEMSFLV